MAKVGLELYAMSILRGIDMTGMNKINQLRRIEKELDELGFKIVEPKFRYGFDRTEGYDSIAIIPKDNESLPVFSRDAEIFIGTLEAIEVWMQGVDWARRYDQLLKVSNDKKRKRKEQDVLNEQMVAILKDEKLDLRSK